MVDIDKAAARLVDMALMHAFLNCKTPDEVALQLIKIFNDHKSEYTPEERAVMNQIVWRAVVAITS